MPHPALIALALYGVVSLLSITLYGLDKRAARKQTWRVKERTLHTVDLLCGWPGGFVAQQLFRHKRRKGRFMLVFWASVALHVLIWGVVGYLWTSA